MIIFYVKPKTGQKLKFCRDCNAVTVHRRKWHGRWKCKECEQ